MLISQNSVKGHLSYAQAGRLIEDGFRRLRDSLIPSPVRSMFDLGIESPAFGVMPASDSHYLSAKIAAVNYQNSQHGYDGHQGAVLLFERPSGRLKAVVDASELTAIRTTAVSQKAAVVI